MRFCLSIHVLTNFIICSRFSATRLLEEWLESANGVCVRVKCRWLATPRCGTMIQHGTQQFVPGADIALNYTWTKIWRIGNTGIWWVQLSIQVLRPFLATAVVSAGFAIVQIQNAHISFSKLLLVQHASGRERETLQWTLYLLIGAITVGMSTWLQLGTSTSKNWRWRGCKSWRRRSRSWRSRRRQRTRSKSNRLSSCFNMHFVLQNVCALCTHLLFVAGICWWHSAISSVRGRVIHSDCKQIFEFCLLSLYCGDSTHVQIDSWFFLNFAFFEIYLCIAVFQPMWIWLLIFLIRSQDYNESRFDTLNVRFDFTKMYTFAKKAYSTREIINRSWSPDSNPNLDRGVLNKLSAKAVDLKKQLRNARTSAMRRFDRDQQKMELAPAAEEEE